MAIVANTLTTYGPGGSGGIVGTREDLADVIYNITPDDRPFTSAAGRDSDIDNTYFEWQTDTLDAPAANAQLEGDEASFTQGSNTVRLGNRTQISRKTAIVSGTANATKKAGRKSEKAYQIAKRGTELLLDIEKICVGINQIQAAGSTTVARTTTAMLNWFNAANSTIGTGAAAHPVYTNNIQTTARVDGTTRPFTLALVKEAAQLGYTNGAKINGMTLMVGPTQKQNVSGFTGSLTTAQQNAGRGAVAIVATVDVLVTDFGTLKVVPNRHMRSRDALVLDWEYIVIEYLRPIGKEELAKTGDAEKTQILGEWGLKVKNQNANMGIFDLS